MDDKLEKFWNLEEYGGKPRFTVAEQLIEENFSKTTCRDESGRFIVKLPFIRNVADIGETRVMAERRFLAIERRLQRNSEIQKQYSDFLSEYIQLGHMEEIGCSDLMKPHSFLPHHFVLRPDSTTTKLRVVFDASAKGNSNLSLNDMMAIGPTIQDTLFKILLGFRMKRYAFTADIEKMYRQVWVSPADQLMQLILWRPNPDEVLKIYKFKTVTYGTRSAPYLAVKCLQTLAEINSDKYPLASVVAKRDFYVDDLISGSDDLTEAMEIKDQLIDMMKSGGMNLRKWCSNHPMLLGDAVDGGREQELPARKLTGIWAN